MNNRSSECTLEPHNPTRNTYSSVDNNNHVTLVHLTLATDALSVSVTCSCTDLPHLVAMTSGTATSFATETELDVEPSQIGSEKDALVTTEASAMSNTVPLNSPHVIPEMDIDTATMGMRVGLGVGTGVGKAVDGIGLGKAVGRRVGVEVGSGCGTRVGCLVGSDAGKADGGGGIGVGAAVGIVGILVVSDAVVGATIGTAVGAGSGATVGAGSRAAAVGVLVGGPVGDAVG